MTSNQTEDLRLLTRMNGGDSQAFDLLFLKYHPNLLRFSSSLLPYPSDEAEDIVVEVFHQLWRQRDSIRIHTSFSAFLYTSVKNRVIDFRRRSAIRNNTTLEDLPVDLNEELHNSPDHILDYKELAENLEKLVKNLPERMQLIFRMNREDQLSYQEIAVLLEISLNSVKTQMYRAVKTLKESYHHEYSDM